MKRLGAALLLSSTVLLFACTKQPALKPDPHYVLGSPYQVGNVWFYPRESYSLDETGLASVLPDDAPRLTSDGELFDQTAMAAAHPTLQLPAIARVTNLENGLQVVVRINDRGTGDPTRLLQLTKRAATLLGMNAGGATQIRLEVLQNESRAAAEAVPGAPTLGMATAPRDAVESSDLPPPPGVRQGNGRALPEQAAQAAPETMVAAPALRLPETVTQTSPRPGQLMVTLDTFQEYVYASQQQAKMSTYGARIVTIRQPRLRQYRVEIGPVQDVARADAILLQALAYGIPDARIVVD
jgi:rare lipoprotein A